MAGTPILDRDELSKRISATIGKEKILYLTAILHEQHFAIRDLITITFHAEKEVAFRASWILENLLLADPLRFLDDVEYLVSQFFKMENRSCQRHYLKILDYLTAIKTDKLLKAKIAAIDMEPVAERCFDLLIDPEAPEAVKVFACQVLFNLHTRYDWIAEMLTEQIRILMHGGKPGIRSRGKALLKQLSNSAKRRR